MSTLADRIRREYRRLGYPSEVSFTRSAGVCETYLCALAPDSRPTLPTARKLARALGVSVRFIYEGGEA